MINRGDIKLAIDMVVNAQDDKLFGGEAEYVINTLEDCGNTIAAQAAVIERLTGIVKVCSPLAAYGRVGTRDVEQAKFQKAINEALSIPTDSTQILDEVRRAERERVAQFVEEGTALTAFQSKDCYSYAYNRAVAIRAME